MTEPMIAVQGLEKAYGGHAVLRGVDLTVRRGEIFALLGPNGAGKTTIVNILTTLVRPDAGSVRLGDVDVLREPARTRELIALTGQYAAVDSFQTGEENLTMMALLAHLARSTARLRTAELLERFDLTDAAKRPVATYSGGMRRRLDLAISLVAQPQVLVLDEPTTGLDPASRSQLWEVVRGLADDGTTVLLTTQYLEEADRLADTVAVLHGGGIAALGTASELKSRVGAGHVRVEVDDQPTLDALAQALASHVDVLGTNPRTLTLTAAPLAPDDPMRAVRRILAAADAAHVDVTGVGVVRPSLDDVFLALTAATPVTATVLTTEAVR